jgi:hypothetical protein
VGFRNLKRRLVKKRSVFRAVAMGVAVAFNEAGWSWRHFDLGRHRARA